LPQEIYEQFENILSPFAGVVHMFDSAEFHIFKGVP